MKCSKIKISLPIFINKQLPESEINKIESHLQICDQCKNEYISLSKTYNLLKEWKDYEPSANFSEKLHHKIESQAKKQFTQKSLLSFLNQNLKTLLLFTKREILITAFLTILTILFVIGKYAPWTFGESIHTLGEQDKNETMITKEITTTYHFIQVGFQKQDGKTIIKFRIGS